MQTQQHQHAAMTGGSDTAFDALAGSVALGLAVGSVAYSIAFVAFLISEPRLAAQLNALFLLLAGLAAPVVLAALYLTLRPASPGVALVGLLWGTAGAIGSAIHGGYELAKFINRPSGVLPGGLPSQVDPRGLMTFGLAALSLLAFSWLIVRSNAFPKRLGLLGYVGGVLLLIVYLGRLILLDPENPLLLGAAALTGVVVIPAFYAWLGVLLRRSGSGSTLRERVQTSS